MTTTYSPSAVPSRIQVATRTPSEIPSADPLASSVERLKLFAISVVLTIGVVMQDSSRLATDTKLDLVVDPGRFLSQALSLWDPLGEGGRIQNQAYGYLFPMGPFFLVGDLLSFPAWGTQRLWEATLLIAAFVGTFLVARALGVRGFVAASAAGLAFALTPRVLSELMYNSAELVPTMVLPWVLLPLVRGASVWSPRRAAALGGVALLFAGGTNAGATLAILPVPVLWLMTREPGPRRTSLVRWSVLALVLASTWWMIPLWLLGRYSPPFVEWIEAAENTTVATSMLASLRGVPHWVSYLGSGYWPAGWDFVREPSIILASTLLASAGLFGLAHRGSPHRLFLFACLGCGLIGVTFGHASRIGPAFDGFQRDLLDGPLVPFRNVHKFQGLVTLPLAVGLGCAVERFKTRELIVDRSERVRYAFAHSWRIVLAGVLGAAALGPALATNLVTEARAAPVAPWWEGAARWLASHSDGARALIVPGAPFPKYFWGSTIDEAIQPVADSPWIVRSAVPLAQPGLIRLLDVLEWRLASGQPDPALSPLLQRSGIRYVVLRHDLNAIASNAVPQSLMRLTLQASPGFELAAALGPRVGGDSTASWLVDDGTGGSRPAIEIFEVTGVAGPVSLLGADGIVHANGTSDALDGLVDAGLDVNAPVLFGSDAVDLGLPAPHAVVTEGIRRQQHAFGGPFRRSGTMTSQQPYEGDRRAFDYLPADHDPFSTFEYIGVTRLTASSSGADVRAVYNSDASLGPWSAFDHDPRSVWRTASWGGAVGAWIEAEFDEPLDVEFIRVSFDPEVIPMPTRLLVSTDAGSDVVDVRPTAGFQTIALPPGETTTLRLTVRSVDGGGIGTNVGIASIRIPGITIERTLRVPNDTAATSYVFKVASGHRSPCVAVSGAAVCPAGLSSRGEEDDVLDRTFTLPGDISVDMAATIRWTTGPALVEALDDGVPTQASASSVDSDDPRRRPGAAVDGDPSTAWVAAATDDRPRLTLSFDSPRAVDALRLVVDPTTMAGPTVVWVHAGDVDWIGSVPRDGLIRLGSTAMADQVEITIIEHETRRAISMFTRYPRILPPGIADVRFDPAVPPSGSTEHDPITFGCDDGLAVEVDGNLVPMSVSAPRVDVLAGRPARAEPCDDSAVRLRAGDHRITFEGTTWAMPLSLTLGQPLPTVRGQERRFEIASWDDTSRRIDVDAGAASILVVHENFNAGWTATLDGRQLQTLRVDGWQQGFVVPEGESGTIHLVFAPQRTLVAGLVVGVGCIGVLLVIAVRRSPRPGPPPVRERVLSTSAVWIATLVVGGALAGVVGVVAIASGLALTSLLPGLVSRRVATAAPALLAIAGAIVASSDQVVSQADAPAIQAMCLLAVALSYAAPLLDRDPRPDGSP